MADLESLRQAVAEVQKQLEAARASTSHTETEVEAQRIAFVGKQGSVTALFGFLRTLPNEEKAAAGQAINQLRQEVESWLAGALETARNQQLNQTLSQRRFDPTVPKTDQYKGSLHPVTLIKKKVVDAFVSIGFDIADGPEIEKDYYNFGALNFPLNHPARDMQDTFFVEPRGNGDAADKLVLRTHTSNIQIQTMLDRKPPLQILSLGKTYRCDSDPTHTPMFHQVEALMVGDDIGFGHMKGVIQHLCTELFGGAAKTRLRPSFFPFVEPGAEVDMACIRCASKAQSTCSVCKGTGWLEIGGCGMVHPNVFENVGYDSERWTGFAFGFGLDRMAMLYFGLTDLRQLFQAKPEFLDQFGTSTL